MKDVVVVFLIGYVLGNFQTSYVFGRLIYKVDIRTLGYGNAGASNALDSIGFKFGLLVAFFDVLKGLLSILLIKNLYHVAFVPNEALLLYVNGYGVILGHIYPAIMRFKGGKGTATLIGVLLGLQAIYGVAGMLIIIIVTLITDHVAISTGVLVVSFVFLTIFKNMGFWPIILSILGAMLSLYLHLPNYKRIAKKEEGRLSNVFKKIQNTKK